MFNEGGNRICSPELLAQIAEVIDSAVLITKFGNLSQFDHRIIYANPAFTKLTGYKQNEIIGRSPDILCDARRSSDNILEFYSSCRRAARFNFELDSFKKQGEEIKFNVDVTPVIDEAQNTYYYILNFKPHAAAVAEPKPRAEETRQPEEKPKFDERQYLSPNNDINPNSPYIAKEVARSFGSKPVTPAELSSDESIAEYCKTQFLANMSHDLRTPLNAIIGFSEVIKDQLFGPIENPRYVSYANDIYRSGQELFATIAEIMELSEIQPNEELVENEKMNICDIIESVTDVLSSKAFESDIKIIKTLDTYDICLFGDRRKIKQAIAGVIGNAIKYSDKGSKIEISTALSDRGDLKIVVYAKSANITGKTSLHGTATKKFENEFPEISLAKRFIEAHEGKFGIFNSAMSGTEMTIHLPASRLSIESDRKTLLKVIS